MRRPVTSFVLALVTVIVAPILVFIEGTALLGASMVTYEPANPLWVKVLSVVIVVVIGLLALGLPVIALIAAARARTAAKSDPTRGAGLATSALVIAGIVSVGVLLAQVYFILPAAGACSLDGC